MSKPFWQGVRAFIGFDIAGSTELKADILLSHGEMDPKAKTPWLKEFTRFFQDVPLWFEKCIERKTSDYYRNDPNFPMSSVSISIWRITGDEIVFVSERLESETQLLLLAEAAHLVLKEFDERIRLKFSHKRNVGVKGVLWCAGFPIRNKELVISLEEHPFIRVGNIEFYNNYELDKLKVSNRKAVITGYHTREFLGPEIDLGFRISQHAKPGHLAVSLDVAELLAKVSMVASSVSKPCLHLVEWQALKGLYLDVPYPIFWVDFGSERAEQRFSYERILDPSLERYFSNSARMDHIDVVRLADAYLADTKETRIKMYLEKPPADHNLRYDAVGDLTND